MENNEHEVRPMQLYDVLEQSARLAIDQQRQDGSLPAGHNGPYHDSETPVRNTAHWLITFLKIHEQTGENTYLNAAQRAIRYLCSQEARPYDATFHHRTTPDKDSCNGLIGQAWTIEALSMAASYLDDPELLTLAEEVFLLHPFDEHLSLWKRIDIDGTPLGFDATFNHQLWFAAAGALLASHANVSLEVDRQIRSFLDALPEILRTYSSGLIYHPLHPKFSIENYSRMLVNDRNGRLFIASLIRYLPITDFGSVRSLIRASPVPVSRLPLTSKQLRSKAVGYHSFNLYAFALLNRWCSDHSFWSSDLFEATITYAKSEEYRHQLEENDYGYPYNPPGFEMPFVLEVFDNNTDRRLQKWWLAQQFRRCYDFDAYVMNRSTEDPATLTARLYQATRLPNLTVDIGLARYPGTTR